MIRFTCSSFPLSSEMYRNQSFSYPGELTTGQVNARQTTQGTSMIQTNAVSFPGMAPFHSNQNSYIIPQDLTQLQTIGPLDSGMPLYQGIVNPQQNTQDYIIRRPPQRPCKRPRRYPCQYIGCDRSFDSQWALERYQYRIVLIVRHIRSHTGEKPFICTYPDCGKSFTDKCALKRHELTHNPEKPFKCNFPNCNKCFKTKNYLGNISLHFDKTQKFTDDFTPKKNLTNVTLKAVIVPSLLRRV